MRIVFSCFLLFYCISNCLGQQGEYKIFTVNDGLPSNNIYRSIEDDKGFLWIGTDAGIARFDGKHFQVFTTRQGLPDNDVLSIVKEKNGRIWVNCFKQSPCYFDEVQNRFINANEDSNLAKVSNSGVMTLFALPKSGVVYYNTTGSFIFRDKKLIDGSAAVKTGGFLIKENNDGTQIKYGSTSANQLKGTARFKIFHSYHGRYIDSININSSEYNDFMGPVIDNGKFYLFNGPKNRCYIYSDINCKSSSFQAGFNYPCRTFL